MRPTASMGHTGSHWFHVGSKHSRAQGRPAFSAMAADGELYDMEAQRLVAETVQASRRLMLDHLGEHLLRNPDATYASWIAALHPDNVQLDHRLVQEGNEWLSAWQCATGDAPPIARVMHCKSKDSSTLLWGRRGGESAGVSIGRGTYKY